MKHLKMALLVPVSIISFSSCGGDHSAKNVGDTTNSYHAPNSNPKTDTTGADTTMIDNSGSGGAKIPKADSIKK